MTEWRLVDTAPKDGTTIICMYEFENAQYDPEIGRSKRWIEKSKLPAPCYWHKNAWWNMEWEGYPVTPLLWQPMPEPPEGWDD